MRVWRTQSRLTSATRLPPPTAAQLAGAAQLARAAPGTVPHRAVRGTVLHRAAPSETRPSHAPHGAQPLRERLAPNAPAAQKLCAHRPLLTPARRSSKAAATRASGSRCRRLSRPPRCAPCSFKKIGRPAAGTGRNARRGGAPRRLGLDGRRQRAPTGQERGGVLPLTWQECRFVAPAAPPAAPLLRHRAEIAAYAVQRPRPRAILGLRCTSRPAMAHRAAPAAAGGAWPALRASDFDAYLLDQDGVLWRGDDAIPGVLEQVARLQKSGKRVFFVRARPRSAPCADAEPLHRALTRSRLGDKQLNANEGAGGRSSGQVRRERFAV